MEHLNSLEEAFPRMTPEEQYMYWCKIHKLHGFFKNIVKGTPNANKPWKSEDDAKIVEMHNSGKSFMEIANQLRRSSWAIECRMKKVLEPVNL